MSKFYIFFNILLTLKIFHFSVSRSSGKLPNAREIQLNCEKIAKPLVSTSFSAKKITKDQYKAILKKIVNSFTKPKSPGKEPLKYSDQKCSERTNLYLKKYEEYNQKKKDRKAQDSASKHHHKSSKSQKDRKAKPKSKGQPIVKAKVDSSRTGDKSKRKKSGETAKKG